MDPILTNNIVISQRAKPYFTVSAHGGSYVPTRSNPYKVPMKGRLNSIDEVGQLIMPKLLDPTSVFGRRFKKGGNLVPKRNKLL